MDSLKKVKFYDTTTIIMIIAFTISLISVFLVPEGVLEKDFFIYPWLFVFFIGILGEIILTIGMVISSFKLKRYGWMLVIIFLGTIFPIIFYFSIMRKRFKKADIPKPILAE